ncbi:MAG TPA: glycoside hydrolase family 99-like domain-containing protein, partial [Opitutales bacterium]|nr:glycoside hydrolase family 99-like domain-containing protein [Opitutales bacterium]
MKKTTLILAALAVWGAQAESTPPVKPVEVMAVYYPHWHVYPRGEEWFGKGWTEWEFVKTPKTRFPGQKIFKPFMGYLDGKDPDDVAVEVDLASNCGIDVFLWDWYWYGGELTMQESLEQGFLKAPNRDKMKFALMWCFHERTDQFRPEYGKPRRRLSTLARTPEDFRAVVDYCIAHYFRESTYWRKNGRPFFSIYDAPDFVKSYGGPEKVKALFAEAAETMKRAGLPPVHWSGMTGSPSESRLLAEAGFDSASSYGCNAYTIPGWKTRMAKGEGAFPYSELVPLHEKKWNEQKGGPLPFIPTVERGWDATYRCRADVAWPWKDPEYPYCGTITNNDVNTFEKLLREAKDAALADSNKPGAILINAWNEYTEGSWLLPDTRDDDASLRAIAAVFGRKPADKYVFAGMRPWWSDKPFKARTYTVDVPTFANLAYGQHTRQKLDVWLPTGKGGKKTPVLVNIHGGGWTLGARTEPGTPGMLKACRDRGVALVSVSYRFIQDGNDEGVNPPVAAPVSDAVAAIRFRSSAVRSGTA